MKSRFEVGELLTSEQAEALLSKLSYSVENIRGLALEGTPAAIVVDYEDAAMAAEIEATVEALLQRERSIRGIRKRTLRDNRGQTGEGRPHAIADETGVKTTTAEEASRLASGRVLRVMDHLFETLALSMNARERHYPAMIAVDALHDCHYLHTFPHNIYLVDEFPHRRATLEQVRTSEQGEMLRWTRPSGYALTPAVCFHCYDELRGRSLPLKDADPPYVITADAECSRHEAGWRVNGYRLRNFRMREIVLIGTERQIQSARQRLMDQVWEIFEQLGLRGTIETATDPFYFPQDAPKGYHQLMAESKYELVVEVGEEQFSIASFNYVGDSLCRSYHIHDSSGGPLHSGCVAFGLDRWCYALSRLYGASPEQWPEAVVSLLEGKIPHGI